MWKPVTNWRSLAFELYVRLYGKRCVKCSDPIELKDAVIYRDGELFALVHKRCKKRR
jgi:hypothetical protein